MKKATLFSLSLLFISAHLFAQQSDTITLNLLNPTYPSSFNFIGNGYWDKTYNDVDYTFFTSQIFSFSHLIEGPGSSWGGNIWNGFTVCNSGDNANHNPNWILNHEWGCMAGGGIMTDAQGNVMIDENGDVMVEKGIPYLVGYWNHMIEPEWWDMFGEWSPLDEPTHCFQILLDDDDEYEAVGVYVNIHPWAYYSNLYGSGPARPLNQNDDHFTLIIHGLNPDGSESGNSVEHIFAKYENSQLTQSTKWEWVDLSSLGEIGGFYCTMATTVVNSAGPVAPMYFCMDKLQVRTKGVITFVPVKNKFSNVHVYSYGNSIYIKSIEALCATPMQSVEILDLTGRMVYQSTINNLETVITLQVPSGIYYVKLNSLNNTTITTKVTLINN